MIEPLENIGMFIAMELQLLRLKDVESLTCMKKTKVYRLIAEGKFPKPKKNGRQSLWMLEEIKLWISSL